jgi:hypothetical protein
MRLVALVLVLAGALLAGCGGSSDKSASGSTSASASHPPTPEEQAVVADAKLLYPSERVVSASCHKVGYETTGDVDSCVLTSVDGSQTQPRQWSIVKTPSGEVGGATPSDLSSGSNTGHGTCDPNDPRYNSALC